MKVSCIQKLGISKVTLSKQHRCNEAAVMWLPGSLVRGHCLTGWIVSHANEQETKFLNSSEPNHSWSLLASVTSKQQTSKVRHLKLADAFAFFRAPSHTAEDQCEGDLLHEFMQKYAKDAYHAQAGEEKKHDEVSNNLVPTWINWEASMWNWWLALLCWRCWVSFTMFFLVLWTLLHSFSRPSRLLGSHILASFSVAL